MVRLPGRPGTLTIDTGDIAVLPTGFTLWRIHPGSGPHPVPWNRLRFYGPTTNRFDPHPPPPRLHSGYAVSYTALDPYTPFAEVYQRSRTINTTADGPWLVAWKTIRELRLVDLTGNWPIMSGASHAINTGRHDYCRAWAHAIHDHPAKVDGLLHASAMNGKPAAALFTPAADSFPPTPEFSRALADTAIRPLIIAAARRLNYHIA